MISVDQRSRVWAAFKDELPDVFGRALSWTFGMIVGVCIFGAIMASLVQGLAPVIFESLAVQVDSLVSRSMACEVRK